MIGTIAFVDADGVEGTVGPDLTMEYDGRYRGTINSILEEDDIGRPSSEASHSELLIGLFEDCPLKAIEVVEE